MKHRATILRAVFLAGALCLIVAVIAVPKSSLLNSEDKLFLGENRTSGGTDHAATNISSDYRMRIPVRPAQGSSKTSEEVDDILQQIREWSSASGHTAMFRILHSLRAEASPELRESLLRTLTSESNANLSSEASTLVTGGLASMLSSEYSTGEMLRVIDISTSNGKNAWRQYLNSRASKDPREVMSIARNSDLYSEAAHAMATKTIARRNPAAVRDMLAGGVIPHESRGFIEGVRELLRQNSLKCTEWIHSLPDDSPAKHAGFRIVGEWLLELGRAEEAELFLKN
jgi:hypothetical protein